MRDLSKEGYKEEGLGEYERDEEQKNNEEQNQEEELSRGIANEAESHNEDEMDDGEEDGEHKRKEEKRQQEKEKLFRFKKVLTIVFKMAAECRKEFIERLNVNEELRYKDILKEEDGEQKRREEKGQQKEEQLFSDFDRMLFASGVTWHQEDRYIEEVVDKEDNRQKKTWEEKEELLRLIDLHSSCRLKTDLKESNSRWSVIAQLLSSFQQLGYSTGAGTAEHRVQYKQERWSTSTTPKVLVSTFLQWGTSTGAGEAKHIEWYRQEGTPTAPASIHSTGKTTSDPAGAAEDKDQKRLEWPTAVPSISVNGPSQTSDEDSAEQWKEENLSLTSATSTPSTELETSDAHSDEEKMRKRLNGLCHHRERTSAPGKLITYLKEQLVKNRLSPTHAPPVSVNDANQQTSDPDFAEYREDEKLTLTSPVSTHSTEQETSDPAGSAEDKDQKILEGTLTTPVSTHSTEQETSDPAGSAEDKDQKGLEGVTASIPVKDTKQETLDPHFAEQWEEEKLTLTSAAFTPSTELETSHAGSGEDKEKKRWKGKFRRGTCLPLKSKDQEKSLELEMTDRCSAEDSGQDDRWKRPTTPSLESNAIPGTRKPDPAENNQLKKWACDSFCTNHSSRTDRMQILALLYCFMTLSSASNHGKQTHCAVNLDGNLHQWRLICYFKINLQERSQDFQVFYIKQEGPLVLVVDAAWDEGEPKLYTAKGFHSEGVVNDTAAIRIQRKAVQHGETFICLLPRVSLEDVLSCRIPKHQEHHATALVTIQPPVPVVSGGWKHVPHREMLLFTIAAIVSKRLYSYG